MRLIIARHGETIENQKDIIQGHMPGTLSQEGWEQVKKLALRLKNEKIDVIYSSDLARAADTAREIAKYHPKIPLYFVKELRERGLGEFEGRRRSEVDLDSNDFLFSKPKGGEDLHMVSERAGGFLDRLIHKHKHHTVLLVTHGFFTRILISVIMNKPSQFVQEMDKQKNTSVNIFDISEDKNHKVILLNSTDHLGQAI